VADDIILDVKNLNTSFFVDGKEVAEFIGMKPKQTLIDALEKAVN